MLVGKRTNFRHNINHQAANYQNRAEYHPITMKLERDRPDDDDRDSSKDAKFSDESPELEFLKVLGDAGLMQDLRERDERDRNRAVAPLKAADDAYQLDTSTLCVDEAVGQVLAWYRAVPQA